MYKQGSLQSLQRRIKNENKINKINVYETKLEKINKYLNYPTPVSLES